MPDFEHEFSERSNSLTFRDYLNRTYVILALGLLVSGAFSIVGAMIVPQVPAGLLLGMVIVSVVAEFGIAIFFSAKLMSMDKQTAWICYFIYCAATGISMSFVLLTYTTASVMTAFLSAAILFACMAVIGYTTRIDMSRFSGIMLAGLIAMLIIGVLNALVFRSNQMSWFLCYFGVILFLGLIAFDVQKLRDLYNGGLANSLIAENLMVYGAFELYLDFINLFIRLLQIFGKRRD